MQHFDNEVGVRRILDIKKMASKEAIDYCYQFSGLDAKEIDTKASELKKEIADNNKEASSYKWILSIKTKEGKVVGKMDVFDMEKGQAYVMLDIPNKGYEHKYGTEAIDQFIKICAEKKYFSKIYLEKNNSCVQKYKELHEIREEDAIIVA